MASPYRYTCGVDAAVCTGSVGTFSHGLSGKGLKLHNSAQEAFACAVKDLLRQGYTRVDSRAFAPPDGGPVRVLTKASRFGGRLRKGKRGEKGAQGGNARAMPSRPRTGGIVAGY